MSIAAAKVTQTLCPGNALTNPPADFHAVNHILFAVTPIAMIRFTSVIALTLATSAAAVESNAQPFVNQSRTGDAPVAAAPPYARTAALVIDAPLVIDALVRDATTLDPRRIPNIPNGVARVFVEAQVRALIRGSGGIAPRIRYLVDLPRDARGRVPRIKRLRVLLFARAVPGKPGEVQLVRPDAQLAWTPALDQQVRAIATEAVSPEAPPAISGIANALHVPGNLVGEGETTISLDTPGQQPVSLSVVRRPGQEPAWSVSLDEVLTNSVATPARDSLLWYRLACGLPETLPDSALSSGDPANDAKAREDYAFIRGQLGSCER